jgi:signal transduction histidine kinase
VILEQDESSGLIPDGALSAKEVALIRLSAGISHELNNILMVIQGNLSLIRDPNLAPATLDIIVDEMLTVSRRGTDLSYKLQTYAGRTPLRPTTFDLRELIEQAIPDLKKSILRDVTVQLSLPEQPCTVHIDRDMALVALRNLATNARAAMKSEGLFTIKLRRVPHPLVSRYQTSNQAYCALLRVSDDGIGMTQHTLESATDPMFSLKGGKLARIGWGLSIVDGFIRQSHGRITLNRRPLGGTRIDIYLPLFGGQGFITQKSREL